MLELTILKSPVINPLTGTIYRIRSIEPILIGRSSSAQIRIVHNHVSRRHVQLIPLNQSWCLQNLSMTNPVIVNGKIIEDNIELRYRDKIRIGKFVFDVSAMSWLKNAVEVTEPVFDEVLAQSEAESKYSDVDEEPMLRLKNSVEIAEPVLNDALSQWEAQSEFSEEDENALTSEFEALTDE